MNAPSIIQPVRLRLLLDPPFDGPANMARDEALLEAVGRGESGPTLRFYAWQPPTISLGYFQSFDDYRALPPPAGTLAVVRRATGGGAILHDQELTYSLTLPTGHPWLAGNASALYERMHRAILHAVGPAARLHGCADAAAQACGQSDARRGPFFCFARRHALDVVADDPNGASQSAKLAGSAQRRTRVAVLQHGSIVLASRYPQQPCAAWTQFGGPSDYREAASRIADALKNTSECKMEVGAWRDAELTEVAAKHAKYAGRAWTEQR